MLDVIGGKETSAGEGSFLGEHLRGFDMGPCGRGLPAHTPRFLTFQDTQLGYISPLSLQPGGGGVGLGGVGHVTVLPMQVSRSRR